MASLPLDLDANVLTFGTTYFSFLILFTSVILLVPQHATITRTASLVLLSALTYVLQETIMQLCKNSHWRATAVPILWIQFMSASELIWVSRVDSAHIPARRGKPKAETIPNKAINVIALLWNLRRVGTRWQVKNIPASSNSGPKATSRLRFVLGRLMTMTFAYLILDIMISGPSPDLALVSPQKETLFKPSDLSVEDVVFRIIGTLSFWLSSALINLIMTNGAAIFLVLSGLSSPADCPPLYGPIGEAYSVRQFWG